MTVVQGGHLSTLTPSNPTPDTLRRTNAICPTLQPGTQYNTPWFTLLGSCSQTFECMLRKVGSLYQILNPLDAKSVPYVPPGSACQCPLVVNTNPAHLINTQCICRSSLIYTLYLSEHPPIHVYTRMPGYIV